MNKDEIPLIKSKADLLLSKYDFADSSSGTERSDNEDKQLIPESDAETEEQQTAKKTLGVSNTASLMHLLKGNIGPGILALPASFMYSGLWVGFFGTGIIGIIAVHCMHLLVQASRRLCQKAHTNSLDYGDVAEAAFQHGPDKLRRFSSVSRSVVNSFICITQFGFCIIYVLFIAKNIKQAVEVFTEWDLAVQIYEVFVLLALIPFSLIKSLKHLAPFSTAANIFTFLGLLVILAYCFYHLPDITDYPALNSWQALPLYFGMTVYAFEGIAVVLPVENQMRTPEDFGGLSGVLNTAMVIVTVMYMAVGFYGYIKFGDAILGSITLNLPSDYWLFIVVKLMFAFAVFISYGVQFYVPAQFLFPVIAEGCMARLQPEVADSLIRVFFVLGTFVLAAIVPHLDLMISLIGALASSALALIFPPLFDILTLWPDGLGRCNWRLAKDVGIMVFGFVGFLTGTVTTLGKIIQTFRMDLS